MLQFTIPVQMFQGKLVNLQKKSKLELPNEWALFNTCQQVHMMAARRTESKNFWFVA